MQQEKKIFNNIEVEDSENFGGNGKIGIRELTLRQLQKCIFEGGKEMCSAGIKKRIINGELIQVAVPNQREIFINNVEMLWNLVLPKVKANKELMDENLGDFKQQLKDIDYTYIDKINVLYQYRKLDDLNHPFSSFNSPEKGKYFNKQLQTINDEIELLKLTLYQKKLTAINFLLNKLNYFDESGA